MLSSYRRQADPCGSGCLPRRREGEDLRSAGKERCSQFAQARPRVRLVQGLRASPSHAPLGSPIHLIDLALPSQYKVCVDMETITNSRAVVSRLKEELSTFEKAALLDHNLEPDRPALILGALSYVSRLPFSSNTSLILLSTSSRLIKATSSKPSISPSTRSTDIMSTATLSERAWHLRSSLPVRDTSRSTNCELVSAESCQARAHATSQTPSSHNRALHRTWSLSRHGLPQQDASAPRSPLQLPLAGAGRVLSDRPQARQGQRARRQGPALLRSASWRYLEGKDFLLGRFLVRSGLCPLPSRARR